MSTFIISFSLSAFFLTITAYIQRRLPQHKLSPIVLLPTALILTMYTGHVIAKIPPLHTITYFTITHQILALLNVYKFIQLTTLREKITYLISSIPVVISIIAMYKSPPEFRYMILPFHIHFLLYQKQLQEMLFTALYSSQEEKTKLKQQQLSFSKEGIICIIILAIFAVPFLLWIQYC